VAITWAQVLARFPSDPALAAVDADAGELWATDAGLLSESFFGARYELAQILWAAHFALAPGTPGSSGAGGPAGPVTSRSEGGVSESYAAPSSGSNTFSASDSWWSLTKYGQMFASLLRSSPRRILKMDPGC
jgi:hypothetical protein